MNMQDNRLLAPEKLEKAPTSAESLHVRTPEAISEAQAEVVERTGAVLENQENTSEDSAGASHDPYAHIRRDRKTQKRELTLEQKIERMSAPQLRHRIAAKYEQEIHALESEAYWMNFPWKKFSQARLNEIVAKIRLLQQKIHELADIALEALRAIYRSLALSA